MSTYAIANAIEKFANNFKYAIDAKNQIEKEKLAFEKEKFEYYRKQLNLNESDNKPNKEDKVRCNHDWIYDCSVIDLLGRRERHRCRLCGELKVVETARI
jgi:hypothetical protein